MYKKRFIHLLRKCRDGLIFFILISAFFAATEIPPVHAGGIKAEILGYAFGNLPLTAQNPLREAVQNRPPNVLEGGTYFIVGNFEMSGIWGIGHLGAAIGSESPDWGKSIWFIVKTQDITVTALQGTQIFDEFLADLPKHLKEQIELPINRSSQISETFLFPWDKSQTWRYTYSWHGSTSLSLDFAPSNVAANNTWMLASKSGTIKMVCGGVGFDTNQIAANLTTDNGITTYRHIDYNSYTGQNINNQTIPQGRKIALLYSGNQGEGYYNTSVAYPWPSCVQGSSQSCVYIQYNTTCGAGTAPHIHWTLPTKPFTVEGWTVGIDGVWTQAGQANRGIGSNFTSSNPPTATLVNSVLPTSRTGMVGSPVTIFNTVVNAGVEAASGVTLSMSPAPAGIFTYNETNCATNAVIGAPNATVNIPAGGVACYVLSFTPSATFAATHVHIRAQADNAPSTNLLTGINTWLLRATDTLGPDIIALTTTTDFHQVACSGSNAFAAALSNVGAAATGDITAVASTGSATLPLVISISETDPGTGVIIGDHILQSVGSGENRTVAVFVTFNGCVNFDPAVNRIFIEFRDASNNVVGSTSTAVSTNR
jgi:hypothetical protein